MTEKDRPKQPEVKFFKGLSLDTTKIYQKDELLAWEEKVIQFKKSIQGNIAPEGNAFTGKITTEYEGETFTFFWRSWQALTRKYRAIDGKSEDTGWAPITFCAELPDRILSDNDLKSSYGEKAEEYVKENYGAIWCAIIETCSAEHSK